MNVFTPVPNDYYSVPRAQIQLRVHGTSKFIKGGDSEAITLSTNLTEIERYSKEYGTKVLARSDVIQKDATLNLTLLQLTPFVRAALFMSEEESYVMQAAISSGNAVFTGASNGDIYSLGALDVAVSAITDGETDPVSYALNTHYKVDRRTGAIEIITKPAGAGEDIEVTFTAPEITASARRQDLGFMSNNGVRCEVFIRGVNDIGQQVEVWFWDVLLRPSGDIELQGGDEYQQVQLTGRVFADGTRPPGFEYGRIRVIPKGQPV